MDFSPFHSLRNGAVILYFYGENIVVRASSLHAQTAPHLFIFYYDHLYGN